MDFLVAPFFSSDFKKMNYLYYMEEDPNSQLPYSEIEEIRVSQIDDSDDIQYIQSQQSSNNQNQQHLVFEVNQNNTLNQLGVINSNQTEMDEIDEVDIDKEIEREREIENEIELENMEINETKTMDVENSSEEYDYKKAFLSIKPRRNDMIQNQNILEKFLTRYIKIIDDDDFKSLELILLKIFYDQLIAIYGSNININYNITYPQNALNRETVNYLLGNMKNFIKEFKEALFNSYLEMIGDLSDERMLMSDYQIEGSEKHTEMNFKTLQNHLKTNMPEMKRKMEQLPERFLTALFFRYMYGICVLPVQFRENINQLMTNKLVPYTSHEKYVNEILFDGYWSSIPKQGIAEPYKIKEVIEELLDSEDKMKELAKRTVIELIKAKKAARTVNQGNTLTSLMNASMRLLSAINKRGEGEFKKKYIEKRGDENGEATRYMNEVERFKYEESKPKKFRQQIYINIEDSLNMLSEAIENGDEKVLYSLLDLKHKIDWEKEKKGQSHFYFEPDYKKKN